MLLRNKCKNEKKKKKKKKKKKIVSEIVDRNVAWPKIYSGVACLSP
jgi:hypothetical protein